MDATDVLDDAESAGLPGTVKRTNIPAILRMIRERPGEIDIERVKTVREALNRWRL